MGKEIGSDGFTADDFARFSRRLAGETRHAHDAYARGEFAADGPVAGFEPVSYTHLDVYKRQK